MSPNNRPLSPHLQVYRWSVLMASSIFHRLSGVALYASYALLVAWLLAVAGGFKPYLAFMDFATGFLGRTILFFATWALMHHMLGGLRHLIWDLGLNFDPEKARLVAIIAALAAFGLTLLIWAFGYGLLS